MRVSVVCVTDRPDKLPLLIWSLVAQTHTDWELIAMDQSDDKTDALIQLPRSVAAKVKMVPCTRVGDWGQSAKEHAAKELATGEVLMFPNDDAYYVPIALMALLSVIELGADLAICGWLYDLMGYLPMPPSTNEGHIDVGGFMVRRETFLKVGWTDKGQTGDANLVKELLASGAVLGNYDRVLYVKN